MTTVTTAAQRRAILANAHAAYLATGKPTTRKERNAKYDVLEDALRASNAITKTDQLYDVYQDGTTLCIRIAVLDADDFDVIELDAYGNTLRGQE